MTHRFTDRDGVTHHTTESGKWSFRIALGATGVAVALAVAPVMGAPATYDAGVAVLTATLIAVIWYTRWTFEAVRLSRTAEERRREAEAAGWEAALREELTALHGLLDEWIQATSTREYKALRPPRSPTVKRALDHAHLFGAQTAHCLARVATSIDVEQSTLLDKETWGNANITSAAARRIRGAVNDALKSLHPVAQGASIEQVSEEELQGMVDRSKGEE